MEQSWDTAQGEHCEAKDRKTWVDEEEKMTREETEGKATRTEQSKA